MKFCSVPAFRLVIGAAVSLVVTVTAQEEYEFQIIRRGNHFSIHCYLDSYYIVEIQSKRKKLYESIDTKFHDNKRQNNDNYMILKRTLDCFAICSYHFLKGSYEYYDMRKEGIEAVVSAKTNNGWTNECP